MRTNRRKFFAKAGVSAAALTLATSQGAAAAPAQTRTKAAGLDKDGPILKIGDAIAVADTAYGSAETLEEAIEFYDTRFNIGLTAREKADLAAFLRAL